MTILWIKFPDNVVSGRLFSVGEQKKFEDIFSAEKSGWRSALDCLGLKVIGSDAGMIFWLAGVPYFNWSYFIEVISGGAMTAVKTPEGKYRFSASRRPFDILRLLSAQWKIARFLHTKSDMSDRIAESLALGIAVQSLLMRLGRDAENMASWLSDPARCPVRHRKTIMQIQAVQKRRTDISRVWREMFPDDGMENISTDNLPEFFWDDDIPDLRSPVPAEPPKERTSWKGKPVFPCRLTGMAVAVQGVPDDNQILDIKKKYNAPVILVFRHARPETTEYFSCADAVFYCEGGVLSHACTVARERNIPCITALGRDFFEQVRQREKMWLRAEDGAVFLQE